MRGKWLAVLAGLWLVCGAPGQAFAASDYALATIHTDKGVYSVGSSMLVYQLLTNETNEWWTFQSTSRLTFNYEIYRTDGVWMKSGTLGIGLAQYIVPGQSDVFAQGMVSLKKSDGTSFPAGMYRIFVFGPTLKGMTTGKTIPGGGGVVIRVN